MLSCVGEVSLTGIVGMGTVWFRSAGGEMAEGQIEWFRHSVSGRGIV